MINDNSLFTTCIDYFDPLIVKEILNEVSAKYNGKKTIKGKGYRYVVDKSTPIAGTKFYQIYGRLYHD